MIRTRVPAHLRLHHRSLWQPTEPAFWAFAAVLVATSVALLGQQSFLRQLSPGGWALSWALMAMYAVPVAMLVVGLDLYEREPPSLLAGAFAWGAVAATTLAAVGNDGWGRVVARLGGPEFAARWSAALTAPVVEEVAKGLGVVLLAWIARDELDDVMDGFVYGALIGLGFAVVEDVFAFVAVFGGSIPGVVEGFLLRAVASGLYGHLLYTGLVGMAVGLVASARRRTGGTPPRIRWAAAGLCAAAVGGHFLWNSPLLDVYPAEPIAGADWALVPVATAVKGLPLLGLVVLAVRLARRREERWLDRALAAEVEGGALEAEDLAVLRSPARRRAARRSMRRRAGPGAARLLARLQREQVNLAMVRARAGDGAAPDVAAQRAYCRSLRAALAAMPGAAVAEGHG